MEQQRPYGEKQHPFTGQAAPACGGGKWGWKRGPVAGGRRTVKVEILKNTTEAKPGRGGDGVWSVEIFQNTTLTGIVPQRVGTAEGLVGEVNPGERSAVQRGRSG